MSEVITTGQSIPGLELDFKSVTAAPGDNTHINTTTSFVAVTGLTNLVVPITSGPYKLRFGSQVFNLVATRGIFMAIYESGSLLSGSVFRSDSATASAINTITGEVRMPASASTHTYELRIASTFATSQAQLLLGSANNYTAWFEAVTR